MSSCGTPLCHRYHVKAVTKVALGLVLNEKKGESFASASSNTLKKKLWFACGVFRTPFFLFESVHGTLKVKSGEK